MFTGATIDEPDRMSWMLEVEFWGPGEVIDESREAELDSDGNQEAAEVISRLLAAGWEPLTVDEGGYYFKRLAEVGRRINDAL